MTVRFCSECGLVAEPIARGSFTHACPDHPKASLYFIRADGRVVSRARPKHEAVVIHAVADGATDGTWTTEEDE